MAPAAARQGETISLTVGTANAGKDVKVWLFSTPSLLLEAAVPSTGRLNVKIPSGTPVGTHKLAVTDLTGALLGWDDLVVYAANAAAVNLKVPSITGKVHVGATVKVNAGTWWPANVKLGYQWKLAGKAIKKATGSSYKVKSGDLGKALTVTVTASANGRQSVSATSSAVKVTQKPVVNKSLPKISGKVMVGSKVKAKAGSWSPKKVKLAYQWKLNGVAIPKATKSSYTIRSGDLGKALTVTVKASAKGYAATSATSKSVRVIQKTVLNKSAPKVTGKAVVGSKVKASAGKWDPKKVKLAYQWRLNGVAIANATKSSYAIKTGDVDGRLSVVVTASAKGYVSKSVASGSVKVKAMPGKR